MSKKIRKLLLWFFGILVSLILIVVIAFQVSPRPGAFIIGHLFNGPVEITDNKTYKNARQQLTIEKDRHYPSKFQDNTYDVYYPKTTSSPVPVLIWVHGGGFVGGDKAGVDEFATRISSDAKIAVVSMNYQVAPASQYPNQVSQVNELISHLKKADDPKLDLGKLFFGGDSAGAQIAGQYVAIQSNQSYAKEMQLTPLLTPKDLRGLISYCGPLDLQQLKAEKSDSAFMKFFVKTVAWSLIGTRDWRNSTKLIEASLVDQLTKDFPATFITDGNAYSFQDQGLTFSQRLQKLGVPVTSLFYQNQTAEISHEYQFDYSLPEAQNCYQQTLNFVTTQMK